MKVVFLARLFYPHIGGVEKHVYELSTRLIEEGHSVTVITEQYDSSLKKTEVLHGITIYRIPVRTQNWFKKLYIWRWVLRNRTLFRNADIIHCHDVFFWYLPLRFLLLTKKVYTTFHGYEGDNIPGRNAVFMHKLSEFLSRGNICVGDYLKKWYGTKATFVTYGATNIPNLEVNFPRIRDTIKCIFIGRLVDEAGFITYLKGIKILVDQKYPIELIILGDGNRRKEGERFCMKNNIKAEFKGFVNNGEKYLKDAHFVFASRYLGIMEAFAMKKLIFAQYNNAIKYDYFSLSPFLEMIVVFKNEHELAEEIVFYIHNIKLVQQKTEQAYKWVNGQTWDHMADLYLKLWRTK